MRWFYGCVIKLNILYGYGGEAVLTIWHKKIDAELKAVMEEQFEEELIPVYIWIKDINYQEVKENVYKKTGFSQDSFAVNGLGYASFLNNEMNELTAFHEYLENTKEERKQKLHDIKSYISESRQFAREAYNEQNRAFVSEFLNRESLFISQYAPMIICELSNERGCDHVVVLYFISDSLLFHSLAE